MTGIGQPAMTALPIAWLALLAALQGSDDYDELAAAPGRAGRGAPPGHPADPVHDLTRWAKALRAGGGATPRARCTTSRIRLPFVARMVATERIEAAARAGEAAKPGHVTEELEGFAEPAAAMGARRGGLRSGGHGGPVTSKRRSRMRWPSPSGQVARSTWRASNWPTASGCAVAAPRRCPTAPALTHSTPSRTCAPGAGRACQAGAPRLG